MLAPLRQFLIVLLVLLQTAAPLVHAHVGDQASSSGGLHLPELEMLKVGADGTVKLVSVQHVDSMTAIVALGSGIKLAKIDPQAIAYAELVIAPRPQADCAELINFSPHPRPLISDQPFLSDNISRAPPV